MKLCDHSAKSIRVDSHAKSDVHEGSQIVGIARTTRRTPNEHAFDVGSNAKRANSAKKS